MSVEVDKYEVGGEPIMPVEVDNDVVGGVEAYDGSVVGRLPSVAGNFVEEVEESNTEGDIKKSGELKWVTKEEGGVI